MGVGFPERQRKLRSDALAPIGLLAECRLSVPATCLAFDGIGARGWSSYGWVSDAHGQMRRGWTQNRQRKGLVLAVGFLSLLTLSPNTNNDSQRPGGGWLNLVVLPDASGRGSTVEIRAELDAEMYAEVRSVSRSLFVTIVRIWDPTVP